MSEDRTVADEDATDGDATAANDPAAAIEPARYYDDYGSDEWERLERTVGGRLEFEGTRAYLERYLPDAGHVLDAGGGAGRYATWLAGRGYDVSLFDLSARQCDLAAEKAAERNVADRVAVGRGDLRSLPLASDAADAVVCTGGPLSHVVDETERATAIAELRRVAAPGAPVFVSVMGRLAVLQNLASDPDFHSGMAELAATGTYDRAFVRKHRDGEPEFVACHFFRAAELEAALEGAGFDVEALVGLEGIAANVGERISIDEVPDATGEEVPDATGDGGADATDDESDDATASTDEPELTELRETVEGLRTDPAVVDWANHILAVARA